MSEVKTKTKTMAFSIGRDSFITDELISQKAADMGLSKSQYMCKAIEVYSTLDKEIIKRVQSRSEGYDVPEEVVIHNILIKYFVDEIDRVGKPVFEFSKADYGNGPEVITGERLWQHLKEMNAEKKRLAKLSAKGQLYEKHLSGSITSENIRDFEEAVKELDKQDVFDEDEN